MRIYYRRGNKVQVLGLRDACNTGPNGPNELKFYMQGFFVKLGSRSKVYLKSLIRDLDLELVAIIAMSPTTTTTIKLF